jgi:uncharacterized tellurite resistance protein B-like protein
MTRIALAKAIYINNSRLKGILADGLKFKEEEISRIKKYLESNKKKMIKFHRFAAYKAAREYYSY